MRIFLYTSFFLFNLINLRHAEAATIYNTSVTSAGVQGSGAYFSINSTLSPGCLYSILYITDLNVNGKFLYANVLSAYSIGRQLIRVDYTVQSDGTCIVSLINY